MSHEWFFMGIDPGYSSGAIAIVDDKENFRASYLIKDKNDLRYAIEFITSWSSVEFAVIEQVHSSPGQGVSTAFKFGQGYGMLLATVMSQVSGYEVALPQTWQAYTHLAGKRIMSKMPRNNRKISRAKEFTQRYIQAKYPEEKFGKNHNLTDAVAIALYAKRKYYGHISRV